MGCHSAPVSPHGNGHPRQVPPQGKPQCSEKKKKKEEEKGQEEAKDW